MKNARHPFSPHQTFLGTIVVEIVNCYCLKPLSEMLKKCWKSTIWQYQHIITLQCSLQVLMTKFNLVHASVGWEDGFYQSVIHLLHLLHLPYLPFDVAYSFLEMIASCCCMANTWKMMSTLEFVFEIQDSLHLYPSSVFDNSIPRGHHTWLNCTFRDVVHSWHLSWWNNEERFQHGIGAEWGLSTGRETESSKLFLSGDLDTYYEPWRDHSAFQSCCLFSPAALWSWVRLLGVNMLQR